MKQFILSCIIILALLVGANDTKSQTWFDVSDNSSFNFVAPSGYTDQVVNVLFPTTTVTAYDYATTVEVDVASMKNIVQLDTLAGNVEIELDISTEVTAGAELYILIQADNSIDVVTFGNGFYGTVVAGESTTVATVANKRKVFYGVYDGTSLVRVSCEQTE